MQRISTFRSTSSMWKKSQKVIISMKSRRRNQRKSWRREMSQRKMSRKNSRSVCKHSRSKHSAICPSQIRWPACHPSSWLGIPNRFLQRCERMNRDLCSQTTICNKFSCQLKSRTRQEPSWLSGWSMFTESSDFCLRRCTSRFFWLISSSTANR